MFEKKKIGDVLKEAGLIDDFQLESALSHQSKWGGKLGAIIVELGFVQEQELARALAENLHLPYVNVFDPEIPGDITALIKPEIAKKYRVIPARKEGKSLVLAMADPLDLEAMDVVRFITGSNIKPALVMGAEIDDAIRKYYEHENITHTPRPAASAKKRPTGKMDVVEGYDLSMLEGLTSGPGSPSPASQKPAAQQRQTDTAARLDALITLLVEKKIITRDEIMAASSRKKA